MKSKNSLLCLSIVALSPCTGAPEHVVVPVQREANTSYADATPVKKPFIFARFELMEWSLGMQKAQLNLENSGTPLEYKTTSIPLIAATGFTENLLPYWGDSFQLRGTLSGTFENLKRRTELSVLGLSSTDNQNLYFLSVAAGFEANVLLGSSRNSLFTSASVGPTGGISSRSKLSDASNFSGFKLNSTVGFQRSFSQKNNVTLRLAYQRALSLLNEGRYASSAVLAGFLFHF